MLAKYANHIEEHIDTKGFSTFTPEDVLRFTTQAEKFVAGLKIAKETEARFTLALLTMYDLAILIGIHLSFPHISGSGLTACSQMIAPR